MSESSMPPRKEGPAIAEAIAEVRGSFESDAALQDAIGRLELAGFDRADLSLPHATPTPAEATPEQGAEPPTADDDVRQARTLHVSGAAAVGALAAAAATAATGGAVAVAAGAAIGSAAAAGGIASALTRSDDKAQHTERERAAAADTLVLSVRTPDAAKRQAAETAMREAGAHEVQALTRSNAGVRPGP